MNFEEMWNEFIKLNEKYKDSDYGAWSYTDAESLDKTLNGEKTAISSLYDSFICEHEPIPCKEDFNIILDDNDNAKCIIKTTRVTLTSYGEVKDSFSKKEAIGDGSIKAFKQAKSEEFKMDLEELGKALDNETVLVLEEFEVVYK